LPVGRVRPRQSRGIFILIYPGAIGRAHVTAIAGDPGAIGRAHVTAPGIL